MKYDSQDVIIPLLLLWLLQEEGLLRGNIENILQLDVKWMVFFKFA